MSSADYKPILDQIQQLRAEISKYHGNPAPREVLEKLSADLWNVNLKADEYFNQETKLPLEQTDLIQSQLSALFDAYSKCLDPAWHVDSTLYPAYDSLVKARNELAYLKKRGYYSNKELELIQKRVNGVESKYVKDQKFVGAEGLDGSGSPPMGQAVLFALLNHCHRESRLLLLKIESGSNFLAPLKKRLEVLLKETTDLKAEYEKTKQPVHLGKIQMIQEALRGIEAQKKDGKFVPADWDPAKDPKAIPEGQAELQYLLEDAYDGVHDLLALYPVNDIIEGTPAFNQLKSALDTLDEKLLEQRHADTLQQRVWHAVSYLKSGASSANRSVTASVGNLLSSAYDRLNAYFAANLSSIDVVDSKLNDLYQELISIRDVLKRLRTEFLFIHIARTKGETEIAKKAEQEVYGRVQPARERLLKVEGKRIDGRFVGDDGSFAPNGQALLASLCEECYALLYEIEAA